MQLAFIVFPRVFAVVRPPSTSFHGGSYQFDFAGEMFRVPHDCGSPLAFDARADDLIPDDRRQVLGRVSMAALQVIWLRPGCAKVGLG
jgi:hypothetical protein